MKRRKITAIAVVITLALALLAGCGTTPASPGESASPSSAPGATVGATLAYKASALPVEFAGGSKLAVAGGRVYYDAADYAANSFKILSADFAGGGARTDVEVKNPVPDSTSFENTSLLALAVDDAQNVWYMTAYTFADLSDPSLPPVIENSVLLNKSAPGAEEVITIDLTNATGGQPFSPNALCADADGNVYAASSNDVVAVGADGEIAFALHEPTAYIAGLVRGGDGKAVYLTSATSGSTTTQVVKTIDFAAQSASATTYTGSRQFTAIFPGGGDYAFYARDWSYISGVKLAADGSISDEPVIGFVDSDIDNNTVGALVPADDGFFTIGRDETTNAPSSIIKLTPNPDAAASNKTVLTLGSVFVSASTKAAIRAFNRASDDARIELIDYSVYNTPVDYTRGGVQLDLDIMQGKAPDIICFVDDGSGADPFKYASKGAFADLNGYLDGDGDISRGDLFGNILDAGSIDGKLYVLIPSFNITTYAGKASVFGDKSGATVAELGAILDAHPGSALSDLTAAMFAAVVSGNNLDFFATGDVRFDSPEFIELLEVSKKLPLTGTDWAAITDYEQFEKDWLESFKNDKTLLWGTVNVSNLHAPRLARELFGEDVTFLGLPSYVGGSGNVIRPDSEFAINASSPNKELAWAFLKSTIAADSAIGGSLPTNRAAFEAMAAAETVPVEERDFTNGVSLNLWSGMNNFDFTYYSLEDLIASYPEYKSYAMTEEGVAQLRAVIESANTLMGGDAQIVSILYEELPAFYAGAKSAEDTAKVIQSRVAIYLSEQS
ncbi:MAG: hypothetical protein LBN30_01005 [Oscillospiraceae bacterium]|jgi:hypothetical protein|nr:hypothetical protein [Oscillospiraceae bacterium]